MSKFIKYILFCFFIAFCCVLDIKAISVNPDKVSANVGSTFDIVVSNRNSNSGYNRGYNLNYSRDDFQLQNGCGSGGIIRSGTDSCKLTFSVKSDLKLKEDKKLTITIDDAGNNANESTSIEVTINKNINDSSSTTEKSSSKTTTTTTTVAKSDNAFLKAISVLDDNGAELLISPSFKKDVYEYSLEVEGTVKTVTINPQLEDAKSNVVLSSNAMEELKAGENNKITITVTAESGVQKAYVLNIKREALNTDATLSKLSIVEVPRFKFDPDEYEYDIELDEEIEKLNIKYTLSDEESSIEITGNEDLKDGSVIKILVTAPDGTKKEYRLNIVINEVTTTIRQISTTSDKNPIVILILSMVGFALLGAIIYVIKKK